MSRHLALILLAAALSSAVETEKPQYLITSPYTYRAGEDETVNVQLFGSKSCEVEVRLKPQNSKTITVSANGTFTPGEQGKLILRIPKEAVRSGRHYYRTYFDLDATVCGAKTESRSVTARPQKKNNIFIQTDKPIYKPGQKIRMRILSLDKDLKLTGDKVANVHVVASASRIKQWNNVKLEDGMASLELRLSKEPVLGRYTITAFIGKTRRTQTIEVAKYVLPKYEVKITPPEYMALDQKEFMTTICAKYTYGKNVKGTLNALLCLKHEDYSYRNIINRDFKKCQNITREINGCTDISLLREELNVGEVTNIWRTQFLIDAQVTETLTGVTLKSKALANVMKRRSVKISFSGTSDKFKPGLPFKYVLKVTRPDGSPATGAKVRVTISRGWNDAKFYNKTFVVTNGLISESIDDATYNAQSLVFKAALLDKNPYPVKASMYPVTASHSARPWYSPSFSYLEIHKTQNTPAKIDSEASLTVRYTVRNNTGAKVNFHYTIMCKGDTVKAGTHTQLHDNIQEENPATTARPATTLLPTKITANVTNATLRRTNDTIRKPVHRFIIPDWGWWKPKPDPVKQLNERPVVEKFDIKFPVTMEMVPSCRVMVYYVREDKEVVADSVDFDVEDKLENQVSVSFEDDERKPGEKTNLILKATPGSRVAFVAVDKSIHLLKAGNELTKEKIRPHLQTYQDRAYNSNPKCRNSWNPWWRGKRSSPPFIWGDRSDYADASEAFNVAGITFLSDLSIFTKPCPTLRPVPLVMAMMVDDDDLSIFTKPCPKPFLYEEADHLIAFSVEETQGGAGLPGPNRGRTGGPRPVENKKEDANAKKEKPVRVRKEFPETWLWADEKLDESGNKTLQVTVPDTITTWVANGFAMSSKTGLGISDTATLKAFQPFFVQMTLPYSVIRGEEIPVTVTVFNYMASCVPIKLELKHKSPDYKVTSYHINKLCVCGDAGQSVKFTIIPTNLGHIPLTVTATTSSASLCPNSTVSVRDAVTRKLLVEPEGIRKEYTQGTFFCPKNGEYKEEFDLKVPKDFVPGSVYPTVTIIGDIMGPALNNLEDLLRMPYGCGEQNMANFAPNIYIMEYLTKTHQVTGDIKSKAENFMEVGYQRELRYKRKNGSYSAFGDYDRQGSMMLTAFVVRSFARAKEYIFVDDEQVEHSIEWFSKKQQENGCFPQYGKVFNQRLQGGVNSELTITAYVTTALLEAGETTNNTMVLRALSCITRQLDSINDSYTMALVTYTLTLAKHSDAQKMMKLLKNKAVKEGDLMYWTGQDKPKPQPKYYYYYRSSAEVEMTAYALLAILHQSDDKSVVTDEIMDIIRWLSKQRNSYGGFSSTQDTCVALQALAEFAGKAYGNNADFRSSILTGSLKMGNYYNHDFSITTDNKLILQTVELPAKIIPGKLLVSGQGVGCALVQASVKYNIPDPEDVPVFDIKVNVRTRRSAPDEETTPCSPLRLDITAKWLKEDVSNMAVVDIKLVTGFSVREESLEELRNDPALNFKRYDIDGQNVQLYFDEIKDMTFSIDIHQDTLVKKLKPAVVKVYDYYEPESQAKVMYRIGEAECYGNKIYNECPRCMTLENIDALIKAAVVCNSTVTRMKSSRGMLKIAKTFSEDTIKQRKRILKKELEYQIPDFCPCEEIYDKQRAVVIGQNSYFKVDGLKTTVVLNSGTTILKYTGKSMKPQIKKIKRQLDACKREGKGKK